MRQPEKTRPGSRRTFGAPALALIAVATVSAAVATARSDDSLQVQASHEGSTLLPGQALELAFGLNPSYQAILTNARRAALVLRGEDGRFGPTFTAGIDYARATSTSLSQQQGVLRGESDSVNGQVGINQRFPWGMSVAADLSLVVDRREVVSPIIREPISTGPGYGINLRVVVVQSLMRGFGDEIGLAQEELAELNVETVNLGEKRAASELARDTLNAYWELWYARKAVTLQSEALAVTERNFNEARERVRAGEIAEQSILPIETDLANLAESLLAAQSDVRRRQTALARFIGWPASSMGELAAAIAPPAPVPPPDRAEILALAAKNTPEVADLRAAAARADIESRLAADRARPRLDATAWMSLNGLGDRDPGAALAMWAGFEAVTVFVGLDYELPLDRTFLDSEAGARRLVAEEARQQLARQEQLLAASAVDAHESWSVATERVGFARRTADIAARSAAAQKTRLDAGAATVLEWLTAEQQARNALLRVERLTADVAIAATTAQHIMGTLLAEAVVLDARAKGPTP